MRAMGRAYQTKSLDNIVNKGVVVVAAAGNEGYLGLRTINSPATAINAIAVGAVDKNMNLTYFSSKGPVGYSENLTIKPDVVAPGLDIYSTWSDGYTMMSGTSMATPRVSGIVALMLQVNSSLTPKDAKNILEKTALDLGEKGEDNIYGAGLVNAYCAVLNASIRGDIDLSGHRRCCLRGTHGCRQSKT